MPSGVLPTTYTGRLLKVQVGQESVWGTPTVATSRLMGLKPFPSFKAYAKSTIYDEDRGGLANGYVSNVLKNGGEFSMDYEYMSYEDIIYMLNNTLKAVSPSGGGPYTWTFPGPLTAVNALQPFTVEWGYDIMTGQYAGCIGQKYTLKGEGEKQWDASWSGFFKSYNANLTIAISSSTNASPIAITTATAHGLSTGMQVNITGHLVNTAANGNWVVTVVDSTHFTLNTSTGNGVGSNTGTVTRIETPSIADRTVTAAPFSGVTQLWMESAGGTAGTTAFTGVFLGFEHTGENNVKPLWTGDALTPSNYAYDKFKPTLKLDLIENAQVKAFVEAVLMAGTGAVIRIKQTSGANSAQIDFAGVLTDDPDRYKTKDGAVMISLTLEGRYDGASSLANQVAITIVNGSGSLV